jgi:hypothetical protein
MMDTNRNAPTWQGRGASTVQADTKAPRPNHNNSAIQPSSSPTSPIAETCAQIPTPDPFEIFRSLLHWEEGTGYEFGADCPLHRRGNRHLQVTRGPDHLPILCCRAGCSDEQVLSHFGLAQVTLKEKLLAYWNTPQKPRVNLASERMRRPSNRHPSGHGAESGK